MYQCARSAEHSLRPVRAHIERGAEERHQGTPLARAPEVVTFWPGSEIFETGSRTIQCWALPTRARTKDRLAHFGQIINRSAKTRQWGKGEGVCMGQTGIAPLLVQACGDVHGARPRNRPARGRRSARRPGCSDHACYGQRAAHAEGIRPARRCCALWRSLSRRQPTFVLRPTREVRPELLAATRAPGISISWRPWAAAVARDERASACNEMRQSKTVMKWPPRLSLDTLAA